MRPITDTLPNDERYWIKLGLEDTPEPDTRFKDLLGEAAWKSLPKAIRARFSRHVEAGKSVIYKGVITEMRMSRIGKIFANACRIIGAPLPLEILPKGSASVVTVTEDKASGGQFWTRTYNRSKGFPQIIHSSKRFHGETGLEEYIGASLSMELR